MRSTRPAPVAVRCWLLAVAGLAFLLACSCDDESVTPPTPVDPFREIWIGTYVSTGPSLAGAPTGGLRIDIVNDGTTTTGRVALRPRSDLDGLAPVTAQGASRNDSLVLSQTPDPSGDGFRLRAARLGGRLAGVLEYPIYALQATIDCPVVPIDSLSLQATFPLPVSINGLAFDGSLLWASTAENFRRYDLDGQFVDSVSVLYRPGTYWTSGPLTSDGSRMWGHLPLSVDSSGTHFSRSVLVEFTLDGEVTHRTDIRDPIDGLAHDGTNLWALTLGGDLCRMDDVGTVLERIPLDVPDLIDLATDGTRFWGVGWWDPRLYEMDRTGRVVRVYLLPVGGEARYPTALDFDGQSLWYSRSALAVRFSVLHRLRPASPGG